MIEYYNDKLCIPSKELIERGLLSEPNYKQMAARKKFCVVRQGKGLGNYALVAVDSLPSDMKEAVREWYPNIEITRLVKWIKDNYIYDRNAYNFYSDEELCGAKLSQKHILEYTNNASVIQCAISLYNNAKAQHQVMGERYDWEMMTQCLDLIKKEFNHTLPSSVIRFRKKVNEFKKQGYKCLISGKFGNQNTRRVDYKTEQLILGLAIQGNQPFAKQVYDMYISFVCGEIEAFDPSTGEMFNPEDFVDKKGEPKKLSEATINFYMNKPNNKVLIEHKLKSWTSFMHENAPHVHRHAPEFSLSKVSFDDRDLPRKLKDTKLRPKAYYAYDVASQCVVGFAYNRYKTTDIVIECFRSMFRLLDRHGWGTPAQVEVENHLMTQWKDNFLKADVMFPFVRFCAPQNSQEKYAEPMNGGKKKAVEHRNHLGIGRFYGKGKWRTESKKISDASNDSYEDKEYYTWEQLILEDACDVMEWNNSLHPNQKKYKGMTRWQVFEANINPTLQPINKAVLARYIGEKVETSIRRNSYCRVDHQDWWLSDTSVLEKLAPNNMKVDAYYIPDEEGKYNEVFIYQNDMLVDKLENLGTFNTADAEQTEEDKAIFLKQQKKIASFNNYLKNNAISHVGVLKERDSYVEDVEDLEVETPISNNDEDYNNYLGSSWAQDYAKKGLEDH